MSSGGPQAALLIAPFGDLGLPRLILGSFWALWGWSGCSFGVFLGFSGALLVLSGLLRSSFGVFLGLFGAFLGLFWVLRRSVWVPGYGLGDHLGPSWVYPGTPQQFPGAARSSQELLGGAFYFLGVS